MSRAYLKLPISAIFFWRIMYRQLSLSSTNTETAFLTTVFPPSTLSTSSISVLATMSPVVSNGTIPGDHGSSGDGQDGKCELLGPFALLIQAALGALALLSLVYKRWRERPQRPVKIWAFDASKQVFGSVLLHMANLVMSIFSADQMSLTAKSQTNPCSFYLLNLGIDVCPTIH
jgi:hypothetical protein